MDAAGDAFGLVAGLNTSLLHVIALSLAVSLVATAMAAAFGLPLGAVLSIYRFRGRSLLILLFNALLGLPPVVVGLALYLLLSRMGPLGFLGILFTPAAMIAAQFLLALPIVAALSHRAMEGVWREFGDDLLVSGASRASAIPHVLSIGRRGALTASLAGFGRTISEVGAILIVGGNIAGYTRTMTTTIVLETSKGNLAFALALGFVLIAISVAVSACAFAFAADLVPAPFPSAIVSSTGDPMKSFLLPRPTTLGIVALLAACPVAGRSAEAQTIVLASTTSVQDSGLLVHILPLFTKATGIEVHVIAQGTGQALATAARGDADLVLVHDPDAEATFIAQGHGLTRTEIAWNDFIVVGPDADPAHIAGTHDAVVALRAIAKARAPFVSRGDKSGTDALEKRLWKAAELDPASIGGGWYRDIGGGMGAALNAAAAVQAYTLSDRGTWLSFGNKAGMRIQLEGDRRLLNRYDVILLDPRKHPEAKQDPASRLATWLGSEEGQAAIGRYTIGGERLFHPEADPKP